MSRADSSQRRSLWAIFRMPILLATLSIIGLVSALLGDDVWDVLSWLTLGVPIAMTCWYLRPGHAARSNPSLPR